MNNNNYIYLRDQHHKDVYKLGGSSDIINRGCTYITGEYEKCKFIKIWKTEKSWKSIEYNLQNEFYNLNSYKGSGTEYYLKDIEHKIELYFEKNNIKYELVDINDIERKINDKIKNHKMQRQFENLTISELECKIKPFDYQEEDKLKAIEYFKSNDIGHLLWSCGLGKTYESLFIWHALEYKSLLICVPSLYLKDQFCNAIRNVFGEFKICDNFDYLEEYINSSQSYKIIISTYHSCHKMLKFDFLLDMKIGDECHHLVNSQNYEKNSFTDFHKIKSKKTLFMTATSKELESSCEEIYTMSNKEQFGKLISERSVRWAINNKKITDYNIICIKNNDTEILKILNSNEIITSNNFNFNELLLSAICALKSIESNHNTHLLIYTNKCESSEIINKLINILISKNIFKIQRSDLYHKNLDSKSDLNFSEEITKFTNSKYGIISCVYIFGEGFDLPKLNGIVIGEKMTSDIRIVQSCLRPNRIDSNDLNKKASIIIPYNPDLDNDNDKLQNIITKMSNSDNCIEQKINLVEINTNFSNSSSYFENSISLKENKDEILKLKLRLYTRSCFNSTPKWNQIYNYHKEYNKNKFNSVQDFKNNPNKHIDIKPHFPISVWNGWYDYLNIDCSNFIKSKDEWIKYCNSKNINTVDEYINMCNIDKKLCIEPSYFYHNEDFKGIINELDSSNHNWLFEN